MREHAAWKVETHMRRATGPTRSATRSCISPAALLVNVIARISNGDTSSSLTRYASRCVSTRVLPEPAPAMTSTGPGGSVTASYWAGFSPERSRGRRARTGGASEASGASSASLGGGASGSVPGWTFTMVHPSYRRELHACQASSSNVTGPSLTSATCMSARNRPVATGTPSSASACVKVSMSGSATSGAAAADHAGRRPRVASP